MRALLVRKVPGGNAACRSLPRDSLDSRKARAPLWRAAAPELQCAQCPPPLRPSTRYESAEAPASPQRPPRNYDAGRSEKVQTLSRRDASNPLLEHSNVRPVFESPTSAPHLPRGKLQASARPARG